MSDYLRSTRECTFEQLRPEIQRSLEAYFQAKELGEIAAETVLCCETVSEAKEPGWLAKLFGEKLESPIYVATLLTASFLVWARSGPQTGVNVTVAELRFIRLKAFSSLFNPDTGLEVSGLVGDSKRYLTGYIGLGPEPAAEKFVEAARQAIAKINPESTRKWPSWMGR